MFVVNETGGTWGNAEEVQGTAKVIYAGIASVSCRSVGNCSVPRVCENSVAIVVDETAGISGTAEVVPGMATLGAGQSDTFSLSCGSAGNCAAGGEYNKITGGSLRAFVVDKTAGTWGNAEKVQGLAKLSGRRGSGIASVSCSSAGYYACSRVI